MGSKDKQINIRVDEETLAAIGELQRGDTTALTTPPMSEVIRRAVLAARDQMRAKRRQK